MKILITGITGFVGQALGQELVRKGHEVVGTSRSGSEAESTLPFPAKVFSWDPNREILPEEVLNGIDGIVHLAGDSISDFPWTPKKRASIFKSRVRGLENLLVGFHRSREKPGVFLSASAVGFYGDRGEEEVNEESQPGEGFLAEVCEAWERGLLETSFEPEFLHTRRVILRFGVVLGHGGFLSVQEPFYRRGLGTKMGSGKQWLSWIHLENLVELLIEALINPAYEGIYNGVAPHPIRQIEFSKALAKIFKAPHFLWAPRNVLEILMGSFSELIFHSQNVSSKKVEKQGFQFQYPKIEDALSHLYSYRQKGADRYEKEQWVPAPSEKVFEFFKHAENVTQLIPPRYRFRAPAQILEKGKKIRYQFSFLGISFSWVFEMVEVEPHFRMKSVQTQGPFRMWRQKDEFETLGSGTLIQNKVVYTLPFGGLGSLIFGRWFKKRLQRIFKYQHEQILKVFGAKNPSP